MSNNSISMKKSKYKCQKETLEHLSTYLLIQGLGFRIQTRASKSKKLSH